MDNSSDKENIDKGDIRSRNKNCSQNNKVSPSHKKPLSNNDRASAKESNKTPKCSPKKSVIDDPNVKINDDLTVLKGNYLKSSNIESSPKTVNTPQVRKCSSSPKLNGKAKSKERITITKVQVEKLAEPINKITKASKKERNADVKISTKISRDNTQGKQKRKSESTHSLSANSKCSSKNETKKSKNRRSRKIIHRYYIDCDQPASDEIFDTPDFVSIS